MENFTTHNEAVEALIISALGEEAASHDVDAIADAAIEGFTADTGEYLYRQSVDTETFWTIVADNAL